MAAQGPGIFENDAARDFLTELRGADPTDVGNIVSGALRKVAQAEQPLEVTHVQEALVAMALLLSEYDESVLTGAPDAETLAPWFARLEVELNPARRQIALGAIGRILLPADNGWYDLWSSAEGGEAATAAVVRLREELADSAVED